MNVLAFYSLLLILFTSFNEAATFQSLTSVEAGTVPFCTLLEAAKMGKITLEECFQLGVGPEKSDSSGYTMLHIAAMQDNYEMAKELLKRAKDTLFATTKSGMAPLHVAAWRGTRRMVELFVENRALIDAEAHGGQTPLSFAASSGNLETAKCLLECGASLGPSKTSRLTPLYWAILMNQTEMFRLLLLWNADLKAEDDHGSPLIRMVIRLRRMEMVNMLRCNVLSEFCTEDIQALYDYAGLYCRLDLRTALLAALLAFADHV